MPDDVVHGRHGKHGRDGRDGLPGARGPQGPSGLPGLRGKDGSPGAPGIEGPIGPQGARGERGPAGPEGPQGDVGPAPRHEWRFQGGQVQLRFEKPGPDGSLVWGPWSENLRGATGQDGGSFIGGVSGGSSSGSSGGGNAAGVPLFIAEGDEFVAPANQQTLFAMTIDCEGILDVEGFLVAVN